MTLANEEGVTIAILLFVLFAMSIALGLCYCRNKHPQTWNRMKTNLGFGDDATNQRIQQRQQQIQGIRSDMRESGVTEEDMAARDSLSAEEQVEYAQRMRERFKTSRKDRQPVDIKTYTEGLNALDAMLAHDTFKRMPLMVHRDTNLPDIRGDVPVDTSRSTGNNWAIAQSSKLEGIRNRGDVRVQTGMIVPKPVFS